MLSYLSTSVNGLYVCVLSSYSILFSTPRKEVKKRPMFADIDFKHIYVFVGGDFTPIPGVL